jgi:hypothetical protein
MKYIITESQYRILNEEPEEILEIPFKMFSNDWYFLQEYIEMIGNPPYIITGNLNLRGFKVITLGSLVGVEGYLDLSSNRTIEDLGDIRYVGTYLGLGRSNIKSLGNLESVGGDLDLRRTPLSEKTTSAKIRKQVYVGGEIFF